MRIPSTFKPGDRLRVVHLTSDESGHYTPRSFIGKYIGTEGNYMIEEVIIGLRTSDTQEVWFPTTSIQFITKF